MACAGGTLRSPTEHQRPGYFLNTILRAGGLEISQITLVKEVVPTANPKRLTAAANRLILAPDERSLQVDLVRLDRTVPVADCVGSRDPRPSTSTQRAAAQIPETIGVRQR